MRITIHRGTRQIGGCVTEIASEQSRVFIDIGADLPGLENKTPFRPIDGLTTGDGSNSALFITHYHGDHIGRLGEVLPEIPVYMGETAKGIQTIFAEQLRKAPLHEKNEKNEKINTFRPLGRITQGGVTVTPLMVDHSAFDAYMFVVEAGGKRVLHTGDFRTHGPRGRKTFQMLECYAKNIDVIVCEGTALSRPGERPMSERELGQKAKKLMRNASYVFVLCASTNIDRIGEFYHANPKGRFFVCDEYQKAILALVQKEHAGKSSYYDFRYAYSYGRNLDARMEENGFCMLVRQNEFFRPFLEKYFSAPYREKSLLVYSMWPGYLDGKAKNEKLCDFLNPYPYTPLHTSGHASQEDLARLYHTVAPKLGLIPIHGEAPEAFKTLVPDGNILVLDDGETLGLTPWGSAPNPAKGP